MYKSELAVPPAAELIAAQDGSAIRLQDIEPVSLDGVRRRLGRGVFKHPAILGQYEKFPVFLGPLAHEYDLVVGDDTSGRLPAMIACRYINHLRQWQGLPHAKLGFVAPNNMPLSPHFHLTASNSETALIVTERVGHGISARKIAKNLSSDQLDLLTIQNVNKTTKLPWARNFFVTEVPYLLDQSIFDLESRHTGVRKGTESLYAHALHHHNAPKKTRFAMRNSARMIAETLALGTIEQVTTPEAGFHAASPLGKLAIGHS